MPKKPTLPLVGIRVLDLSYVFAIPYLGGLLSDLGAEVIKIESPHRLDQTRGRAFGPYLDNDPGEDPWNRSGIFHVLNRGKQSLVLDLGQPQGRDVFLWLLRKSDIVLDNYTPRVMPKWGLDYEELKKLKPSLIMLSNTGYGSTGPWSAFPSQGTTLEATMGISYYTGYRGDKPWKVGQSYPDFLACWAGLSALFAALAHMRKTGRGQRIDLGMYQIGAALVAEPILQKQLDGGDRERIGNEHPEHVPSNLYRARGDDQWMAISVESDEQWAILARLMNQPQLADDERFCHASGRRRYRDKIDALVAQWARERDVIEMLGLLQSRGIACGPVFNARDLLVNEHLRHRGFYERVEHKPPIGPRPIIGRPYRLRFRDARIRKQAPRFGEDNRPILRDLLGLNPEQIENLFEAKVVCDKPTNPGQSGSMNTEAMLRLRTLAALDSDYRSRIGLGADNTGKDPAADSAEIMPPTPG
ncbi:MAG: CoA transferase [Betaproteobacteria bacterium]|nr:MAG: CoA transferase [Betaproteobacteria bacterium]